MKGENCVTLLFFRGRVVRLEGGKGGRVVRWQDGKAGKVMRSPDVLWSYLIGPMVAPLAHFLWQGMVSGLWGS